MALRRNGENHFGHGQLEHAHSRAMDETSPPEQAKALWDRFVFLLTQKHGSWLNIAEIELNVLNKRYLNRRSADIEEVCREA